MPDWRVGEFEGKFTDEFAHSNRSEHESGIEAPGASKKLKQAVASEKINEGVISGTNNPDSQKCNSEHIQCANGTVSQNINSTGGCKDGSNSFPLRGENAIAETRCPTDNWNSCQFALSNGSSILNNHSAPEDSLTYGDNDLNYIDWPGIDNFEDVDTLFRRSDSTYGHQQLDDTNGLSWIPSLSDAVYSSDAALQQGFETSYSDYGILDDLSAFECTEDKSLPLVDPSAAVCDNQFNDTYMFSEQKNVNAYGEQIYQGDVMELPTDQICNGNGNMDMLQVENQYSSENAIQDSSSPSNITSESYPEKFSPSGGSFAQRNSKAQKKTVSSDNSVEESSFRQLQDAVSQLDVQTKLCIRDGLYRLARSAQHRQVFPNTMNSNGDSQDVMDMQNAETSRKFADPRSIETQTNPIDRSIALLLFHQSSDNAAGAVDDVSSLKSPASKKQHQGPAANQGIMPASSSIYSPRGQGGPKDAQSRDNY
ncbi:unnamed protein product [Urochloa humidicola]